MWNIFAPALRHDLVNRKRMKQRTSLAVCYLHPQVFSLESSFRIAGRGAAIERNDALVTNGSGGNVAAALGPVSAIVAGFDAECLDALAELYMLLKHYIANGFGLVPGKGDSALVHTIVGGPIGGSFLNFFYIFLKNN